MDDATGVGEASDDNDYQAPPPRVARGSQRIRISIPQDDSDESP